VIILSVSCMYVVYLNFDKEDLSIRDRTETIRGRHEVLRVQRLYLFDYNICVVFYTYYSVNMRSCCVK